MLDDSARGWVYSLRDHAFRDTAADGGGLLAESKAGARVRLRREWSRARGDTVRKAWALTDHGATTWFDSLGVARAEAWSVRANRPDPVRMTFSSEADGRVFLDDKPLH